MKEPSRIWRALDAVVVAAHALVVTVLCVSLGGGVIAGSAWAWWSMRTPMLSDCLAVQGRVENVNVKSTGRGTHGVSLTLQRTDAPAWDPQVLAFVPHDDPEPLGRQLSRTGARVTIWLPRDSAALRDRDERDEVIQLAIDDTVVLGHDDTERRRQGQRTLNGWVLLVATVMGVAVQVPVVQVWRRRRLRIR